MKEFNFITLIHKNLQYNITIPDGSIQKGSTSCVIPIRIPKIQRDYALGRETESVIRKRRNLLSDVIQVIYGKKHHLSFDFIYGYMMDGDQICSIKDYNDYNQHKNVVFDPLDGQQRLTSLFLFYWFFGRSSDLQKDQNHSLFIYQTRSTSEEFCNWLVTKDAKTIIDSWKNMVIDIENHNAANRKKWDTEKDATGKIDKMVNRLRYPERKIPLLTDYISTLDDFKWDWHDDPNIRSMIVVIESIYNLMTEMGLSYDDGIKNNANLDKITFHILDDLKCDGNELFEKMNARGKALTDFEEIKSALEEEMEIQKLPTIKPTLSADWREKIDNKWVDYYWGNIITSINPSLDGVRNVEQNLKRLILRMIAKSFFNKVVKCTNPVIPGAVNYGERFQNCVTSRNNMDAVVKYYIDYALHERSLMLPNGLSSIDFERVYLDIENMLYNDNGKWNDIFQYLDSKGFHFHRGKGNATTLLDDFLSDKPTRNVRVMFYAVMEYLKYRSATIITSDPKGIELSNFTEWVRFVRNIFSAENKNTGLDDEEDANKAIEAVNRWIEEYFKVPRTSATDMLGFIKDYIKNNPFTQEKNRIDEEAIKASLRLDPTGKIEPKWNNAILTAEDNYYLWGQIIAPLSWSVSPTSQYDMTVFNQYMSMLDKIFFENPWIDDTTTDVMLVQAMLCYKDYRTISTGLGSLRRSFFDRDFSWKRYLRDDNGSGMCGELFKLLIDEWIKNYPTHDFDVFLSDFIATKKSSIPKTDWRYFIVNAESSTLLNFLKDTVRTNTRHIYESSDDGHVYYFRSETMRTSNRYELVTSFIFMKLKTLKVDAVLEHVNGIGGAHVEFQYNADTIRVSSAVGGLYNIAQNGTTIVSGIDILGLEAELKKIGVITIL